MMRTSIYFGIILLMAISWSCKEETDEVNQSEENKEMTQEEEAEKLNEMFSEIERMASEENCEDASEWTFTAYGSKACGGPAGFITYSTNINTDLFLQKVEEHRTAEKEFNEKWGVVSDCAVPQQPKGISCENGSAILVY